MLAALAKARTFEELPERRQEAARIYDRYRAELERGTVDPRLLIVEQLLSREIEEYAVETRASLAARELIAEGINVHPSEKIGYVITNAKAKNKAERISTSNRNGVVDYDRQEYATRLKVAAGEVGIISHDDSSNDAAGSSLPLFD